MYQKNLFLKNAKILYLTLIFSFVFILFYQINNVSAAATEVEHGKECYEVVDLGDYYTALDSGDGAISGETNVPCDLTFEMLNGYLDNKLPATVNVVSGTTRDDYITELVNSAIEICKASSTPDSECTTSSTTVMTEAHIKSGGNRAIVLDDLMVLGWAYDGISESYNQDRADAGQNINRSSVLYLIKPPYVAPNPQDYDDDVDQVTPAPTPSPDTPPTAPAENDSCWNVKETGSGINEDWCRVNDTTSEPNVVGRFRRNRVNGSWKCYFYGQDGSYAILGTCPGPDARLD